MAASSPVPIPAVSQQKQGAATSVDESLLRRSQHLIVVLWISFTIPIVRSTYYMILGAATIPAYTALQRRFRLSAALIEEASALFLLWYVMGRQGKTRADIGWNPKWTDVVKAIGLFLLVTVARWFFYYSVQLPYSAYSGHYLVGRSLQSVQSVLGLRLSFLWVAYACLNPFCEELIVRAYTMSEILNLGGSRNLAVIVSVGVQLSYHFYQGPVNVLWLAPVFVVFSIYFARTKRIFPIILVHLVMDLVPVLRGHI